jgi:hypothetical protein
MNREGVENAKNSKRLFLNDLKHLKRHAEPPELVEGRSAPFATLFAPFDKLRVLVSR